MKDNDSKPVNLELVWRMKEPSAHSVFIQGHYCYVGIDQDLVILDIAIPSQPIEVGWLALPYIVWSFVVDGHYAYVAAREGGLRVVDVSTPANPIEIGVYNPQWEVWSVAVAGSYAYISELRPLDDKGPEQQEGNIRVVDVSEPFAPIEVGTYDPGEGDTVYDIVLVDRYAYVTSDFGLRIVDLSKPNMPLEIGKCGLGVDYPFVLVSVGSHIYVGDMSAGLIIVEVSNPTNPLTVGDYDLPGCVTLTAADNCIYASDWEEGLWVLDLSIPLAPPEVGYYQTHEIVTGIAVAENYIYAAAGKEGLLGLYLPNRHRNWKPGNRWPRKCAQGIPNSGADCPMSSCDIYKQASDSRPRRVRSGRYVRWARRLMHRAWGDRWRVG